MGNFQRYLQSDVAHRSRRWVEKRAFCRLSGMTEQSDKKKNENWFRRWSKPVQNRGGEAFVWIHAKRNSRNTALFLQIEFYKINKYMFKYKI